MNSSLSEYVARRGSGDVKVTRQLAAAILVFTLAGCAADELVDNSPRPSDDVSGEYAEPVDQAKP